MRGSASEQRRWRWLLGAEHIKVKGWAPAAWAAHGFWVAELGRGWTRGEVGQPRSWAARGTARLGQEEKWATRA